MVSIVGCEVCGRRCMSGECYSIDGTRQRAENNFSVSTDRTWQVVIDCGSIFRVELRASRGPPVLICSYMLVHMLIDLPFYQWKPLTDARYIYSPRQKHYTM